MKRRSFFKWLGAAAAAPVAAKAADLKFPKGLVEAPKSQPEEYEEEEYEVIGVAGVNYDLVCTCSPMPITASEIESQLGLRRRSNR